VEGKNYKLIVIDACSADANGVGTYVIPHQIVDELGVPIYYVRGISSVLERSDRVLTEPKNITC
jgi:hypothetical protein